jgi:hypothetical protein
MLQEYEHMSTHRPEKESMDMAGIHMVKVKCMDMVEERSSKERAEVEDMMVEDFTVEDLTVEVNVEVVEREHEGMVLAKHWIGDRGERHRRIHQK